MENVIENFRYKILERENVHFNTRKSNKLHNEIEAIFQTLRANGELAALEPLLTHENINVASCTAQYFLIENESKALATFENLAKRKGIDPFVINYTIKQWKNGEINFDY